MYAKWDERYSMGIEEFDRDHQQLFRIANKIIRTVEGPNGMDETSRIFVVREGVKYLKTYFEEHALREEAYMRRIQYPDYVAHKRLHDEFQYVQLARFEKIIERGACTREEVFSFVGGEIGWMLEHVTTADMAIVGKGILCQPPETDLNRQALEQEVNMMFTSTLNMDVDARILRADYGGEPIGETVCQKFTYQCGDTLLTIIVGIEKPLMSGVAQIVYGDLGDADMLILASLELFGAAFWKTLVERLACDRQKLAYRECHFLSAHQVREIFRRKIPAISILFQTNRGKLFVSAESDSWNADNIDRFLQRFQ